MKKILSYLALAAVATAFTACCDDEDPKAEYPTDPAFLNTPVMANQTILLETAGGVDFTLSQPNYGVALVPTYALQISLDASFEKTPSQTASASLVYSTANEQAYYQLPTVTQSSQFTASAQEIAEGISAMLGYKDISEYSGRAAYSGPVYCRVLSTIPSANPGTEDNYSIFSNVVTLANVVGYAAVRQPGWIYLVGAPEGWAGPTESNAAHYEAWKLYEAADGIGSKIYHGTFTIPAGSFIFRFYTALTGWDTDSWGSQKDDSPVNIAFDASGTYSDAIGGPGYKGSYQISDWAGGTVEMTVNLKSGNVTFKKVD